MTPDLPSTYKKYYPFRLACPSFIYPGGYADNVRRLAACVDEIELLLLESAPECLPRPSEITELASLAANGNIVFNIHLPTDISIGADEAGGRTAAVASLLRAIDLTRTLAPVSYTLHVPFTGSPGGGDLTGWRDRVMNGLERLLTKSGLPARAIALETLDYPFYYLDAVLQEFNCSVCLDTGHLMVQGQNCGDFYRSYQSRVTIIHVHGVDNGRDHLALDRLSESQAQEIGRVLREFRRSVSLEVFSAADLRDSLKGLDNIWHNFSRSDND